MASQPPMLWKEQSCPNCGNAFRRGSGRGGVKSFCQKECKRQFESRSMNQGRAIIVLAKAWRECRNKKEDGQLGSACLSELVSIIDLFNQDDRAAGRPHSKKYADQLLKQGRYIDRKKA